MLNLFKIKHGEKFLSDEQKFKVPIFWVDQQIGGKSDEDKKKWLNKRKSGLLDEDLTDFRHQITEGAFKGTINEDDSPEVNLHILLDVLHLNWGTEMKVSRRLR